MGGIFLLKITLRLILIFLCGYLVIEWFPITYPIDLSEILVGPIIYPLEFFAATLAFFFCIFFSLQLFQEIHRLTMKIVKKKHSKR
jgi:hypothetical protein